ncbi:hypothetical protein LTR91_003591 [Friedmanniomyces endolithicus]|uniref:Signal recognition particle receptor subunit beta n=1 Tax=Friedmanniomyces endolithicus TaxID=329885 RepID=A0AAN6QZH3_9PEZI|nr:hypothetical protein LTR35_015747 [Friedmanniomyces endolithicus]KAK0293348.1 hypothetical protein LTS00_007594 [Friedmanniomyces endolithicus]KAK0325583.1 hypothetical protein LTR82_003118 [Friedmanniomyces endolithicus]KAK0829757.1 hypothetical protein LTR73_003892 [Friedmanniomyces endolithicus]KAK0911539.1 hypothetical protein LTR57_015363 [Friedmanniomyces endolithicus]
MKKLEDWLTWALSPSISAILVTLIFSLTLPILIHTYLYKRAVAKELPTFLLLGPSGAGKTSLLTLLANGTPSPTHTSQAPQTAICQLPSTTRSSEDKYRSENDTSSRSQPSIQLLDTPGHGKLRHHAISSLTFPTALKGLLFVVDSAVLSSAAGLTETAEFLYDVLLLLQKRHTQGKTSKTPLAIPVLLVANKQDVFTSLPAGLVKSKLEEELGKVRQTRSKGLLDSGIGMDDDGEADEESSWLGEYGANGFKFAQMREHGVDLEVVGTSTSGEGEGEGEGRGHECWSWIGANV